MDEQNWSGGRQRCHWQAQAGSHRGVARLGKVARQLMDEQITSRHQRFDLVNEAWNRVLPEGLRRHCRLDGISNGQLKVLVDSPVYLHELRMCSGELLKELQKRCRSARIRKIRPAIG